MKLRRRTLWLAALLLLALDLVAILWPRPANQAEAFAANLRDGMLRADIEESLQSAGGMPVSRISPDDDSFAWRFDDGSTLAALFKSRSDAEARFVWVHAYPPDPVPPLTSLRRSLARVFPALKE
jgi:hypothetical protein